MANLQTNETQSSEARELEARDKHPVQSEATRPGPVFRPDVDILENAEGYWIHADLPGVDESSVDVRLERGTLSLDAHLAIHPEEGWNPLHREYRVGGYHREFRVSEDIDPAGVSANMKNGVLTLHLPRSAERQPRAIPVQAG